MDTRGLAAAVSMLWALMGAASAAIPEFAQGRWIGSDPAQPGYSLEAEFEALAGMILITEDGISCAFRYDGDDEAGRALFGYIRETDNPVCRDARGVFAERDGMAVLTWDHGSGERRVVLRTDPDIALLPDRSPAIDIERFVREPMTFRSVSNGGNCLGCGWIVGEGVIADDTHEVLRRFHEDEGAAGRLVLDSPGGSLQGGIALGRYIRELGIEVAIGRSRVMDPQFPWYEIEEGGQCLSACAYAFLGGQVRQIDSDESIGFHQFYDEETVADLVNPRFSGLDRLTDQLVTGAIVRYVNEMGIDARLYPIVAGVSPGDFVFVDREEAVALNIDNSEDVAGPWRVSAFRSGLIAELDTRSSGRNFRLYCVDGQGHYLTVFSEGDQQFVDGFQEMWSMHGRGAFAQGSGGRTALRLHHIGVVDQPDGNRIVTVFAMDEAGARMIAESESLRIFTDTEISRAHSYFFLNYQLQRITGDSRLPQRVFSVCA